MSLDGKVLLMPGLTRTKAKANACYRGWIAQQEELKAAGLPECFGCQHLQLRQPYIPDPDEVADAMEWEADVTQYARDLRTYAKALARCNACAHLKRCFVLSVGVERYYGGGGNGA